MANFFIANPFNLIETVQLSDIRNPIPTNVVVNAWNRPNIAETIFIHRVFSRMHAHRAPKAGGAYEYVVAITKASDPSTAIAGNVLDFTPPTELFAYIERDWNFFPNTVTLNAGDTLLSLTYAFGEEGAGHSHESCFTSIGSFCAIAYTLAEPPKFITITTLSGNPTKLIGVKSDGSVWRANDAAATPLVWTQVS